MGSADGRDTRKEDVDAGWISEVDFDANMSLLLGDSNTKGSTTVNPPPGDSSANCTSLSDALFPMGDLKTDDSRQRLATLPALSKRPTRRIAPKSSCTASDSDKCRMRTSGPGCDRTE